MKILMLLKNEPINANEVKEVPVDIENSSVYTLTVEPKNTWISVNKDGVKVKDGKDMVRFGSVSGRYNIRVKHDKPEDILCKLYIEEFK